MFSRQRPWDIARQTDTHAHAAIITCATQNVFCHVRQHAHNIADNMLTLQPQQQDNKQGPLQCYIMANPSEPGPIMVTVQLPNPTLTTSPSGKCFVKAHVDKHGQLIHDNAHTCNSKHNFEHKLYIYIYIQIQLSHCTGGGGARHGWKACATINNYN